MIDLNKVSIEYPRQNTPWLELNLSDDVMKHLWKSIKEGEKNPKDAKHMLAGNISKSFAIDDTNHYFTTEVLLPLAEHYENKIPDTTKHLFDISPAVGEDEKPIAPVASTIFLDSLWANYQYKHEFNPVHNHTGAFSFVVWMKIPYNYAEQKKEKFLEGMKEGQKAAGTFYFEYVNMFGEITNTTYGMSPDLEGRMLFFPSRLRHGVQPFYSCDEKRVSISGNLKYTFKYSSELR